MLRTAERNNHPLPNRRRPLGYRFFRLPIFRQAYRLIASVNPILFLRYETLRVVMLRAVHSFTNWFDIQQSGCKRLQ